MHRKKNNQPNHLFIAVKLTYKMVCIATLVSFERRKKKTDSNQDADLWLESILNSHFGHTSYEHMSPNSPLNMEDLQPAPPMSRDHSAMLPAAPPCENNAPTRFENTARCTKWAQKIWQEWSKQRQPWFSWRVANSLAYCK